MQISLPIKKYGLLRLNIAKRFDFDLSMIHAAGHINIRMPHYMFTESWQFCEAKVAWMKKCRISAYIKIATALNRHKKAVNGSKILFLGVAYKPNIDDERESPALEIMDITTRKGGIVSYNDPHIPLVKTHGNVSLHSVDLTAEALQKADCVVLTTTTMLLILNLSRKMQG